ncbi:cytochrome P450 [Aspergillus filifer]
MILDLIQTYITESSRRISDPSISLSLLVLWFFFINITFLVTYLTIIYPYFYSPFRHLPRPKGEIPLLGQGTTPYTKPLGSTYLKWTNTISNSGIITYRTIFNQDRLLLTSPKAIAEILVHNTYAYTKHPAERSVIGRFLGDGLTISEGDTHKLQRKLLTPVYSGRNVRGFYGVFWNKAVELADSLQESLSHSPVNDTESCHVKEISHWATRTTMDIIGLASLGKDFDCLSGNGSSSALFKAYQEIFTWTPEKDVFMALNRVLPRTLVSWLPWWVNERIDATSTALRYACERLVREKMDELRSSGGQGNDLLSIMTKGGGWDFEGLVEQLLTIIAAGHETSASAFTWTVHLLATHNIAQERLRSELWCVIPTLLSREEPPSAEVLSTTLDSLPYLTAVINESLRLSPPVPLIRRVSKHSSTLLNYSVPANTHILISPYAVNRSRDLWGPDAEAFKPERWLDAVTGKVNNHGGAMSNYANLTFSHGGRSCIGQGFARAELKTLIAVFVSRFRFEMADPGETVVPVGIVSVRPRCGLRIRVQKVEDIY